MTDTTCEFCPDGHRRPGSKPMSVELGWDNDPDGQPVFLRVQYVAGHHVSEHEVEWLRGLIRGALTPTELGTVRTIVSRHLEAVRYSHSEVGYIDVMTQQVLIEHLEGILEKLDDQSPICQLDRAGFPVSQC